MKTVITSFDERMFRNAFHRPFQLGYCRTAEPLSTICEDHTIQGSWELSPRETTNWSSAYAACKRRCLSCRNCLFISFSLKWKDCSWFRHCEMDMLQQSVPGFRTCAVRRHDGAFGSRMRSAHACPLGDLFEYFESDKKREHNYQRAYCPLFLPIRDSVRVVVELGFFRGAGSAAFAAFFHNADVYGIDEGKKYYSLETVHASDGASALVPGHQGRPLTLGARSAHVHVFTVSMRNLTSSNLGEQQELGREGVGLPLQDIDIIIDDAVRRFRKFKPPSRCLRLARSHTSHRITSSRLKSTTSGSGSHVYAMVACTSSRTSS